MSRESQIVEEISQAKPSESFDANERNYPISFEGGFEPVSTDQIEADLAANPEILDSIAESQIDTPE